MQLNGNLITTLNDGQKLDADGDGFAGGVGNFDFTTVSVSRIPGTTVSGRVIASEPDANGNDVPLEGVTIRVDGFPELDVETNSNGIFTLHDVPAPNLFVHIDGTTTRLQAGQPVPTDGAYPIVGKELESVPGQTTVIGFSLHLPFVPDEAIHPLTPGEEMTITLPDSQTQNDPDLAMVSLTIPADSLMNEDGSPGTEVGIFRVDSDRLPAPLPDNLNHSFDITVQADAPIFDQPAGITFPNTEGLAPGEKSLLMSFDHARAEWIVVGSMTVSADGTMLVSDPGEGVRAPGWHGVQSGVSVDTDVNNTKPSASDILDAGLTFAGNTVNTFFSGIGLLAATIDNTPIIGNIPGADQGLSAISGILGGVTGYFNDAEFGIDDQVSLASGIIGLFNFEPVTQTLVDAATLSTSVAGFGVSAAQTGQAGVDLIQTLGDATDWALTIGDISDRAIEWADNVGQMASGAFDALTIIESLNGQPTSDPAILQQLEEAVSQIIDGYAPFRGVGIREELRAISNSYINWLDHFDVVYAGFFEGGDQIPYMIQDADGNVVTRGVSDTDGTFDVVLPAESSFVFTIVDPFRGWGITQTIVTGENGTRQDNTAFLLPTPVVDTDMDGLSDIVEETIGTLVDNPDTDGDGLLDSEYLRGLNPLDARGFPTGIISNLPMPGSASDVVTASRPDDAEDIHAYVATGSHGLTIMDISQFDDAILLGQIDLPGVNQSVAVNSDRTIAAIAAGSGGLHIVDISKPMMPELIRTENLAGSVTNVEINNGLVYATVGNRLVSLDLVAGQETETITLGGNVTDISRDGNMLYTMDSSRTLRGIDISAFAMVTRGSLALPNGGSKLFVGGGIAYASNVNAFRGGFATVDISDPDTFTLISDVDVPAGIDAVEGPIAATGSGLAVQGGRTAGVASLSILDVSDPTNTDDLVTRIDLPRTPTGVSIAGGIAIVSDGTAGVQVINYLPFDTAQVAPTVNVQPAFNDVDGGTAGIQVVEGSSLPFSLDVTDDVQVRSVELLIDGIPFASDITFPYELTTPAVSSVGLDQLTAQIRVVDGGGNITLSNPIDIDIVPDTVAPAILSMDPEDGSERSRLQRQFRITFDEPMNPNSLNTNTIQIFDPNGNLVEPNLIEIGFNDTSVTMAYPELQEGTHELRLMESMIRDRAGNPLGAITSITSFDVITSTAFWIGTSGDFNNPANWNTGVVPGPMDDVLISVPGDQIITVNATHNLFGLRSAERFNVIGGSLQVTGEGQLLAGLDQTGGSVGGSAPMEIYTDSVISGGNIVGSSGITNFGQLEVQGSPALSGLLTNVGQIIHTAADFNFNSGVINNLAGGIYEIQSGQLDASSGFWNFNNEGILRKTGEGHADVDVYLSQLGGTIEVEEGMLNLLRGGQHQTGEYNVAENAELNYNFNTYDFLGLASGTGDGAINVNATWRVPEGAFASLDFEGSVLRWNTSTLNLGEGITNLGTINLFNAPALSGVLNNDGTIIHNADDLNFNSATINNRPGGVYEIQSGQLDASSGFWNFNNEGTLLKTGDNVATFDVFLSQQNGIIDIQEGQLNLNRSATHTGGTYNVADGAVLNYAFGNYTFAGLVVASGAGTVSVNTQWLVPDAATIDFPGDVLQWNTGTYTFAGVLTNIGTINLNAIPTLGGTLDNEGLIIHNATDLNFNSATINNRPGGVYEIQSGELDASSGFWNFNNEGTLRKTGDNVATFDVFLSQQNGTIDVQEGQLDLTRGATHTGGTYNVADGTVLNYAFGNYTFAGLVAPTGTGTVSVNTQWLVPDAATINFPGDMLQWNTTTYNFAGVLTNIGTINWNGTTPTLSGTLNNEGLIIHNATDLNFNNATINNRPGGVYEIQSGQLDASSGSWNFNNEGILRKTGGMDATIDVYLTQLGGAVEVETGNLFMSRGSRHESGSYVVANGATLNYSGGVQDFVGLATGTGGGTITNNSTWRVPADEQGSIDYAANLLFWNAATYSFVDMTNLGEVNWIGATSTFVGELNNDGLVKHSANDVNFNGGTINNRPGGVYEIQSGQLDASSGSWNFNNEGILRKTGGMDATIDVYLTQLGGAVEVETGNLFMSRGSRHESGSYVVANGATLNYSGGVQDFVGLATGTGGGTITNNSTWRVPADEQGSIDYAANLLFWDAATYSFVDMTNLGEVNWIGATSTFVGELNNDGLVKHSANDVNFNGGTINNLANGTYEFESGQLDATSGFWNFINDGTLRAAADAGGTLDVTVTNNGVIDLKKGGVLNFTRGLVLNSSSEIRTELAGNTTDDYGRMATNANLSIGGSLAVTTANGFTPMAGDSFAIITYPSAAGDFSTFDDGGTSLGYAINPTSVVLGFGLARVSVESTDINGDEQVNETRTIEATVNQFATRRQPQEKVASPFLGTSISTHSRAMKSDDAASDISVFDRIFEDWDNS